MHNLKAISTHQLEPEVLWRKLDRPDGALRVDEHGALNPSCGTGSARACAVELSTVYVDCGDLLPDPDSAVEGGGREDGAKLRVCPADF